MDTNGAILSARILHCIFAYFAALRHAEYEVLSTERCDLEHAISYILKRCSFKVVIKAAEVQLRFLREMKGNYCSGESLEIRVEALLDGIFTAETQKSQYCRKRRNKMKGEFRVKLKVKRLETVQSSCQRNQKK